MFTFAADQAQTVLKVQLQHFYLKIRKRYKLVVLQNDTFTEKLSINAPLWQFISWSLALLLLLILVLVVLIKGTSLREYIVGSDVSTNRKELVEAYARIDSLSQKVQDNDAYLNNLMQVLGGSSAGEESPVIPVGVAAPEPRATEDDGNAMGRPMVDWLAWRPASNQSSTPAPERGISSYTFYSPVRGIVSAGYDPKIPHLATDIATRMNEPIKATLSGHVIFASFTPSTGYVIMVQHLDNLVSVYKHCAVLLKKSGSFVRGGEVIALVGNTGELSTGPHLHFELWSHGNAVNAQDYITF